MGKPEKSLLQAEFLKKQRASIWKRSHIKTPGIHHEYRDFSNFLGYFEKAQFPILGQFWVNGSKNLDFGSPSGFIRAVIFMPFSVTAHQRYTKAGFIRKAIQEKMDRDNIQQEDDA